MCERLLYGYATILLQNMLLIGQLHTWHQRRRYGNASINTWTMERGIHPRPSMDPLHRQSRWTESVNKCELHWACYIVLPSCSCVSWCCTLCHLDGGHTMCETTPTSNPSLTCSNHKEQSVKHGMSRLCLQPYGWRHNVYIHFKDSQACINVGYIQAKIVSLSFLCKHLC